MAFFVRGSSAFPIGQGTQLKTGEHASEKFEYAVIQVLNGDSQKICSKTERK